MTSLLLSLAARRASRLLACLALLAAVTVLVGNAQPASFPRALAQLLMMPAIAMCAGLLAAAALLVSASAPWARGLGQFLAMLVAVLVLQAAVAPRVAPLIADLSPVQPAIASWLPDLKRLSGAGIILFIAA